MTNILWQKHMKCQDENIGKLVKIGYGYFYRNQHFNKIGIIIGTSFKDIFYSVYVDNVIVLLEKCNIRKYILETIK